MNKENKNCYVLILHMEGMFWKSNYIQVVEKIREWGFSVRICSDTLTDNGPSVFDCCQPDDYKSNNIHAAEEMTKDVEYVLIPFIPLHICSKIVNLDDSNPLVELILFSLCIGKRVGVLAKGPESYIPGHKTGKNGISRMITERLGNLEKMGIEFIEPDRLDIWLNGKIQPAHGPKKIITYEDIIEAIEKGKEVEIFDGDVITPLAIDLIREKKIAVGGEQVF